MGQTHGLIRKFDARAVAYAKSRTIEERQRIRVLTDPAYAREMTRRAELRRKYDD